MKKVIQLTMAVIAIILGSVSCQKNLQEEQKLSSDEKTTITAGIDNGPSTKTAIGDEVKETIDGVEKTFRKVVWKEGDRIGVQVLPDEDGPITGIVGQEPQYDNIEFTLVSGAGTEIGTFEGPSLEGKRIVKLIYPYQAKGNPKVQNYQLPVLDSYDPNSAIMEALRNDQGQYVFTHKVAYAKFTTTRPYSEVRFKSNHFTLTNPPSPSGGMAYASFFDYHLKHNDASTTIQPGTYYIAVEPCSLRGLELIFLSGNREISAKRAGKTNPLDISGEVVLTLQAGKIVNLGDDESVDNIVYESVDLGLTSGLLWATSNVGASKPEEFGHYFAWGETTQKELYLWSNYKWGSELENFTKYNVTDGKTQLDLSDDVAHIRMKGNWRMPTKEELNELFTQCTWTWTTQNKVNGYKVIGPNGNSIFLPAAGSFHNNAPTIVNVNIFCCYWSSSLHSDDKMYAYDLNPEDFNKKDNSYRCNGQSVRGVMDPTN